jgi:hypothetical protein
MKPLTDTAPAAEEALRDSLRRMPFAQKWRQMGAIYRTGRALHAAGIRQRKPEATDKDIHEAWMVETLGEALLHQIKEALRAREQRQHG